MNEEKITRKQMLSTIGRLEKHFPKFSLGQTQFDDWYRLLSKFTEKQLEAAVDDFLISGRFNPTMADIASRVRYAAEPPPGTRAPLKAQEAFQERLRSEGRVWASGTQENPATGKYELIWCWYDAHRCVELENGWRLKIEFIMDVLGGQQITNVLRAKMQEWGFDSLQKALRNKSFSKLYQEWEDEMLAEAQAIERPTEF